jgi:hypothetical protein
MSPEQYHELIALTDTGDEMWIEGIECGRHLVVSGGEYKWCHIDDVEKACRLAGIPYDLSYGTLDGSQWGWWRPGMEDTKTVPTHGGLVHVPRADLEECLCPGGPSVADLVKRYTVPELPPITLTGPLAPKVVHGELCS